MHAPAAARSVQDISPVTPLPVGPVLHLPSGDLGVLDHGRLFYHRRWVAAVGVSSRVFLEVRDRDDRSIPVRLLYELRGYLTACGCDLIPLDDRCPLAWRLGSSFNTVRDLWITNFFHESERLLFAVPLPLSARPRIVVPLVSLAEDAAVFWRAAILVADAIFSDAEPLARRFRPQVAHLAAIWERRWNEALARATPQELAADEWGYLPSCDRAWANLVQAHLAPHGYRMQAASLARLL
jgi:hypothetical protein